ncbi:EthD domain-containing protein [Haliea sp.]|uniref:EthD domain-containing protein n=1 Tax=Haliea sp. TaxID=1932666 RepID=UPI00257DA0AB|nr:EthD domain-containing protein [Haliea sp.]|tara:strand:- start:219899 stop:220870 length:972 start_codon:yes stop_codon:yes gene_type:complete
MKIRVLLLAIVSCVVVLTGWAETPEKGRSVCHSGQAGPYGTVALLKKKQGVDKADFSTYWRDIHGMLATRIPGFWTYRQFHLGEELPLLRRLPENYSAALESLDGFADVSFCSSEAIAGLVSSPISELIKQDERNVFDSSYLYGVIPGDSLTLRREAPFESAVGGELDEVVLVLLARGSQESRAGFRAAVDESMALILEQCADLQRLRVNYLQPYDESGWPAPDVNHRPAQQMDAAVEMQFRDRETVLHCLNSGASVGELAGDGTQGRLQLVYGVTARYAMVVDGKATALALRGLPAMTLIQRLGADSQLDEAVLQALYGEGR